MRKLQKALALRLGDTYQVELGMRYGQPSIESAVHALAECHQLIVLPLFPQYSSAATGSAIEEFNRVLNQQWNIPEITIRHELYQHAGYIASYANCIQQTIQDQSIDTLLLSYHGLPERHITKSHCRAACDHANACPLISNDNAFCYRAQCYATSRLLAEKLQLTSQQYRVVFQSRLGKLPWIKPYVDHVLPDLIAEGKKRIAIASPSFVSDCLETLEEINIRLREQWLSLGGEELIVVPCLNANEDWVDVLVGLVRF
jgi:ferrochelatase